MADGSSGSSGGLRALAIAAGFAIVDVAPVLVEPRRARIVRIARADRRDGSPEDLPVPERPDADDMRALHAAVGRQLARLGARDPDAEAELRPRYATIDVAVAAREPARRRAAVRTLVELRELMARHAN